MAPVPKNSSVVGWSALHAVLCLGVSAVYKRYPELSVKGFYLVEGSAIDDLGQVAHQVAEQFCNYENVEYRSGAESYLATVDAFDTFGRAVFEGIRAGHIYVVFPRGNPGPNTFAHIHEHHPGRYVTKVLEALVAENGPWLLDFATSVQISYTGNNRNGRRRVPDLFAHSEPGS